MSVDLGVEMTLERERIGFREIHVNLFQRKKYCRIKK